MIWVMGSGMRAESNRLWTFLAVAAVLVIALFVFDPFGGGNAQSDGLQLEDNDVPFIAVVEHNRAKSRVADEPEEVLEVVIEAEPAVEAVAKANAAESPSQALDTGNRGQRASADS